MSCAIANDKLPLVEIASGRILYTRPYTTTLVTIETSRANDRLWWMWTCAANSWVYIGLFRRVQACRKDAVTLIKGQGHGLSHKRPDCHWRTRGVCAAFMDGATSTNLPQITSSISQERFHSPTLFFPLKLMSDVNLTWVWIFYELFREFILFFLLILYLILNFFSCITCLWRK